MIFKRIILISLISLISFCLSKELNNKENSKDNSKESKILRVNWLKRSLYSNTAKDFQKKQVECTSTRNIYTINNYGMGSGLISLSKAACNSLQEGLTLDVVSDSNGWIWNAVEFCQPFDHYSPLNCYFTNLYSECKEKKVDTKKHVFWIQYKCPPYVHDEANLTQMFHFQGEYFEYLFSGINSEVIKKAEIEAQKIFGSNGSPDNMITVHIRWGDKNHEMGGLLPIDTYVRAVKYFIEKHSLKTVSIFLTTEDIRASEAFKTHNYVKSNGWKIYEYKDAISPDSNVHTPALDAELTKGIHGLYSLISLILASESKYYVLSTASNWSGVIAALRSGIVDPDCNFCTDWIDLRFNPLLRPGLTAYNKRNGINYPHCPHYPYNSEGHLLFPINCQSTLPQLK